MNLSEFVVFIRAEPKPAGVIFDGQIVDGLGPARWTAEDITAEAFHQDVLSIDSDTWDSGLLKVRVALANARQK